MPNFNHILESRKRDLDHWLGQDWIPLGKTREQVINESKAKIASNNKGWWTWERGYRRIFNSDTWELRKEIVK